MRRLAIVVILAACVIVPIFTIHAQPRHQVNLPSIMRAQCPPPPECVDANGLPYGWTCYEGRIVPFCALRGLCPLPTPQPAE